MNYFAYWGVNNKLYEGFGGSFSNELNIKYKKDLSIIHEHKIRHSLFFEALGNFNDYSSFLFRSCDIIKSIPLNFLDPHEPPYQDLSVNLSRLTNNIVNSVFRYFNYIKSIKKQFSNSELVEEMLDCRKSKKSKEFYLFFLLRGILFHKGFANTQLSTNITLLGEDKTKINLILDKDDLIKNICRGDKDLIENIQDFDRFVNIGDCLNQLYLEMLHIQKYVQKELDYSTTRIAHDMFDALLQAGYDEKILSPCIISTDDDYDVENKIKFSVTWISIESIKSIFMLE